MAFTRQEVDRANELLALTIPIFRTEQEARDLLGKDPMRERDKMAIVAAAVYVLRATRRQDDDECAKCGSPTPKKKLYLPNYALGACLSGNCPNAEHLHVSCECGFVKATAVVGGTLAEPYLVEPIVAPAPGSSGSSGSVVVRSRGNAWDYLNGTGR